LTVPKAAADKLGAIPLRRFVLTLVIIIILIALVFDFINGFHDAANSIATVVSTRVLTPRFAVMWAAFFNFVGAFGFETHVAKTMGSGMIQLSAVNEYVILAGLIGAIVWDLITCTLGCPPAPRTLSSGPTPAQPLRVQDFRPSLLLVGPRP